MTKFLNPILLSEHSLCSSWAFVLVTQEEKGDLGSSQAVVPSRQAILLRSFIGGGGPNDASGSETGRKTLVSRHWYETSVAERMRCHGYILP